jgi:hypothetical protein
MTIRLPILPIAEFGADVMAKVRPLPDLEASAETFLRSVEPAEAGRSEIEEPLRVLLAAYEQEASLTALGRAAIRWDVKRYVANLSRLYAEEQKNPAILEQPIEAPIIITGVPRSGTTFLHSLMAEDPANQVLQSWQAIYPYPAPGRTGARDKRPRDVDRQLRSFALLAPEIRDVHLLWSQSPQECTEITGHLFQSLRFDTTHNIPSYRSWLNRRGHVAAYKFHKRFLQHLQYQNGGRRRWVLKAPDHLFAFEALREVYPDARIVFVHRDPLRVIQSVAQLTEILRRPFTTALDRIEIGRQVTRDWVYAALKMVEVSRDSWFPPSQILNLHYREVISRPLETVGKVYAHFGVSAGDNANELMSRWMAAMPNGGYARNAYSFERHGLNRQELSERFQPYMEHFGVEPEAPRSTGSVKVRQDRKRSPYLKILGAEAVRPLAPLNYVTPDEGT